MSTPDAQTKAADCRRLVAGFLLKCAEDGLDARTTAASLRNAAAAIGRAAAVVKEARAARPPKVAFELGDLISKPLGALGDAAIYAPPLIGAAAGYGLGHLSSAPPDPAQLKREELVEHYRRLADAARRRKKLSDMSRTGDQLIPLS